MNCEIGEAHWLGKINPTKYHTLIFTTCNNDNLLNPLSVRLDFIKVKTKSMKYVL